MHQEIPVPGPHRGGAVLQGAFILAKAKGGAEIAAASVDHLHRYIELLFEPAKHRGKEIS